MSNNNPFTATSSRAWHTQDTNTAAFPLTATQEVFDSVELSQMIFASLYYEDLLRSMLVSRSTYYIIKQSSMVHSHRFWMNAPSAFSSPVPTKPFFATIDFNTREHRPELPVFLCDSFDVRQLVLSYKAYSSPFGGKVKGATRITPGKNNQTEVWRRMPLVDASKTKDKKVRLKLAFREKQELWEDHMLLPVTLGEVYDWLCEQVDPSEEVQEVKDEASGREK